MSIKELLKELNIEVNGEYDKNGSYKAKLDDADLFGHVFSKIDKKCEEIDNPDNGEITDKLESQFEYDDFLITLIFDLEGNNHLLIITTSKKDNDKEEKKEDNE